MCSKCTEKHLNDLKTFDHEVRTYRLKESDVPNQIMLYSRNKSDEFKPLHQKRGFILQKNVDDRNQIRFQDMFQ